MSADRAPRKLKREQVDYRVGMRSFGRLGFDAEPRGTVTTTIWDVFQAKTVARMLEFTTESDGILNPKPPLTDSLQRRIPADEATPEFLRIQPFKGEVVEALIRARIPGHT